MSYESPVTKIWSDLQTQYEDGVLKAVQKCGFDVDKEELIKALMYDRNQYERGYKDRDAELIRCKDCEYFEEHNDKHKYETDGFCFDWARDTYADWYCSNAKRRAE